ncbi:MAG: tRNA (adenosine(37)-N6)-dimethylallyltransferase MiaA [Candidatus Promineifilaceae bacterium]|nr:tRNA (adenosine(37)-N6)-dimethylallyltransferase MiaA [Candidatus Promineifilaceae bacterium]
MTQIQTGGRSGAIANRPLLVIVGPTAVGKTSLSLHLAQAFDGEIISADSRLFYRGMDIGTDKPPLTVRRGLPHHLIDIRDPDSILTLGEYQRLAYRAIEATLARQRLPILVGGTGQYIWAVVEGWGIPRVPPNDALRTSLGALGRDELARWLRCLDPESAARIHPNNVRRVIRALEVTLLTGRPMSELRRKQPPPYRIKIVGLRAEREWLYERIDRRVQEMVAKGLLAEVRTLLDEGYSPTLPAMSALGYRQMAEHLQGTLTLAEAIERIQFETHRFVRQQNTWFREGDARIDWYDVGSADWRARIVAAVDAWLRNH